MDLSMDCLDVGKMTGSSMRENIRGSGRMVSRGYVLRH